MCHKGELCVGQTGSGILDSEHRPRKECTEWLQGENGKVLLLFGLGESGIDRTR